jgi:hypothetical protein
MTTSVRAPIPATNALDRIKTLDWERLSKELDAQGNAILERVLSVDECKALEELYPEDGLFRSRVVMSQHGFGRGEYKYFDYPLPEIIEELRTAIYPRLAPLLIAGTPRWASMSAILKNILTSSSDATMLGNRGRRPCFSNTRLVTTTVSIRIFTESMFSRYKWPSCYPTRRRILQAENLYLPSSGRACSRGRKLFPSVRGTP